MKITENCIADIPIDRYHNDPDLFDGPSISSTGLRTLIQRSPAHLFASSRALNPNAEPVSTKSLTFGKAAHLRMMGDDRFLKHFAILPFPDLRTKAAKEWVDEKEAAGLDIIRQDDLQTIDGMAAALRRDPVIRAGLFKGEVEKTICCKDKETGIWLKARPDVIPIDSMIGEYKTTVSAHPDELQWTIEKYGYHQQLALIGEVMEVALGHVIEDYAMVFQEKTPPYAVTTIPVDEDYIACGRVLNRAALRKFAECIEKNEWPGYETPMTKIAPRQRLMETIARGQELGTLPSFAECGIKVAGGQQHRNEELDDHVAGG